MSANKANRTEKMKKVGRSASTESTTSTASIQQKMVTTTENTICPIREVNIFNCIALVIYCNVHDEVPLTRIDSNKGLFFPISNPLRPRDSLQDIAITTFRTMIGPDNTLDNGLHLIKVLRTHINGSNEYINISFFGGIMNEQNYKCHDVKGVTWFDYKTVIDYNCKDIWGPEVQLILTERAPNTPLHVSEQSWLNIKQSWLVASPTDMHEMLIKENGWSDKHCLKLYSQFVQHTFPSQSMNKHWFSNYLSKLSSNYSSANIDNLFRAFAFNKQPFISFIEFLLGFAAMSTKVDHGGKTGNLRCAYVYRYYNAKNDNNMDYSEVKKMINDIHIIKKTPITEAKLEEATLDCFQKCNLNINQTMNEKTFRKCVGELFIRGTSVLFRIKWSIFKEIKRVNRYGSLTDLEGSCISTKGICLRCRKKKYCLAYTCCTVFKNSQVGDWNHIQRDRVKGEHLDKACIERINFSKEQIVKSEESIKGEAIGTTVIQLISAMMEARKTKNINEWENNREEKFNQILSLCEKVEVIFKKEHRCVRVCSPCFVFGDIHGNLNDLLLYEKILWPSFPKCCASNTCFLVIMLIEESSV